MMKNRFKKTYKLTTRIIILMLFFAVIFTSELPSCFAATPRTVKVGVFPLGNFHNFDENGVPYGYDIDYIKKVAQFSHWNLEFVKADNFASALKMLDDGKIDILAPTQKTDEREEKYLFSAFSMSTEMGAVQALSNRDDLIYGDNRALENLHYGAMKDSPLTTNFINKFCNVSGFTPMITYYDNSSKLYEALYKKEVDAIATNIMFGDSRVKMIGRYSPQPVYYITRKQETLLMSELNDAMTEVLLDEPNFQAKLFASCFPQFSNTLFSQAEKSYIASLPEIKIGFKVGQAPVSYVNGDGDFCGITRDILDNISNRTGLKFKYEALPSEGYSDSYLKNHGIYVVAGEEYNSTFEKGTVHLTVPYFTSEEVLVSSTMEGLTSDSCEKVAIPQASKDLSAELMNVYPKCDIIVYETVDKCLNAVKNGTAKEALINRYVADCKLSDPTYTDLKIIPVQSICDKLCLSVHNYDDQCEGVCKLLQDPLFISITDKAIKQISEGSINDIIIKNTAATRYHSTFRDLIEKNKYTVLAFLLLILITIIMLIWKQSIEKEKAAELSVKNRDLLDAVGQADRASKAKSQFLARMSHEIRTPMNAIVGITEIAKRYSEEPEKIEEYLEKISASSKVLLNIINDVLDMSAIESSKIKIASDEFDLKEIINNIETVYSPQCAAKKVELIIDCDLNESKVLGDSLRVQQILLNLVSNAYKFTQSGGKINLTAKKVSGNSEKMFVKFSVSDTGIGMSKEMLSRLFKPFEQESAKTAQEYGGSGLGLSITKNLVEMMNGAIKVESEKGKGTTFTVDIPFALAEKTETAKAPETNIPEKPDFTGHKILLAEDNELNREIAVELLKFVHLSVDCAVDGKDAVEKFEASAPGTYETILMDIQMPVMNGNAAAEAIRKSSHADAKSVPIFAMTANAFSEDISASLNAGMNGHISKPIDVNTLYKTLAKAILK